MSDGSFASSTWDRLRADMDSGQTGDKVSGSDPATAPLRTDEEAAGKPPSKHSVARARQMELAVAKIKRGNQEGTGAVGIIIGFIRLERSCCGILVLR